MGPQVQGSKATREGLWGHGSKGPRLQGRNCGATGPRLLGADQRSLYQCQVGVAPRIGQISGAPPS